MHLTQALKAMKLTSEGLYRFIWFASPMLASTCFLGTYATGNGMSGWVWAALVAAIIGSLIITFRDKQLYTIIIVCGCSVGTILMARIMKKYIETNPAFIGTGMTLARGLGIVIGIITITVIIYYNKTSAKEKMGASIDQVSTSLAGLRYLVSTDHQSGNDITIKHNDVYVCQDTETRKEVIIPGKDRYLHTLLIGATGTGKTSTTLAPMIWQDLQNYNNGYRLGLTLVAPDYEFCYQVREWCEKLGIPFAFIDLDGQVTSRFNPLEGDPELVSEIMRTVLRSTFGEQEAFFAQAQEQHAKNTMLLLKKLRGDNLTLMDVYSALMDIEEVQIMVDDYVELYGEDVVTTYFKKEAFGRNRDKLHQFAMGLRLQISDLLANSTTCNVLVGQSDINLDRHLAEGGVLLVNTAQGKLGRLGKVFGQFVIMHIQNAVFRRPGTEFTRIPHYLYIDELPVYFNPELEDLLNRGRKYRCACTFTIQGPSQLERGKSQGEAMRDVVINGCRNKIVIGVESSSDSKLLSEMFGEEAKAEIRTTRKSFHIMNDTVAQTEKLAPRFTYTEIQELEPWQGIIKVVVNGCNQKPVLGQFEEPWLFMNRVNKSLGELKRHQIAEEL